MYLGGPIAIAPAAWGARLKPPRAIWESGRRRHREMQPRFADEIGVRVGELGAGRGGTNLELRGPWEPLGRGRRRWDWN